MAFINEVIEQNIPIWDACAATPFVKELLMGTLPVEKFKRYMVQDSIYLKNYARVYGMAIYRSENLSDIQMYYSMLSFVTEGESLVRVSWLKRWGLEEADVEHWKPLPENRNYIDFLFRTAEQGSSLEILMAVLPCMLSYSYIFRKRTAEHTDTTSEYSDFILDYGEAEYCENCKLWCEFAEKKCKDLPEKEKRKLSEIFKKASLLELDFWKMAYEEQRL